MDSLGDQFIKIMERKEQEFSDASEDFVNDITEAMKINTEAGKAFGNDEYNNTYSNQYARRKKGGRKSPVTLRGKYKEIENTIIKKQGSRGAVASFASPESARIFRYHHKGIATGGKVRSIFPKSIQSIPSDIMVKLKRKVHGILQQR